MTASGLEKWWLLLRQERNDERRSTHAFQRGTESQSNCNKAEKSLWKLWPLLKEQLNKWQRKTLEVRKHLTEKGCHLYGWPGCRMTISFILRFYNRSIQTLRVGSEIAAVSHKLQTQKLHLVWQPWVGVLHTQNLQYWGYERAGRQIRPCTEFYRVFAFTSFVVLLLSLF